MKLLFAPLLFLSCSAHAATSADACPILPRDAGLTWSLTEGPDFDVCYASDKAKRQVFGVYLGMAANFEKDRPVVSTSKVGGFDARWVAIKDSKAISREALVLVKPKKGGEYQAHVWVSAKDQAELVRLQAILSAIRFRE